MSRPAAPAGPGARAAFRQVLPRLVIGLGVAAVGMVFTLDNLDLLEARQWLRYWPALVLAFGAGLLLAAETNAERLAGAAWSLVGAALLLDRLDVVEVDFWDLWPLLLIVVGVLLVVRSLRPHPAGAAGEEGARLHAFAVMSGVVRKSASPAFEGGSLTAIMGGAEVDLRGARLAGGRAVIDAFAFWGGVEITVPPGWAVEGRVWPLMGGFDDKTHPPAPEDAEGTLVITGWAIMGGIAVKN